MADRNSIKVKVIGDGRSQRQFPHGEKKWGRCVFTFDLEEKEYDWIVVYNDFKSAGNKRVEKLSCPPQNSLLITSEPSNITCYDSNYTSQFGHVLTSQEKWALDHPHRIFSQPALIWFYGLGYNGDLLDYEYIKANAPLKKNRIIATVCSSKKHGNALHHRRFKFTHELKRHLPELDIYGHGVNEINDKAQALDDYKYHISIENFIGEHHWTEKLSDPFLGAALQFYCGAPDADEYFPKESFIPIDIFDIEKSAKIIKDAIANNEYEKRLPFILEAREMVMNKYNIFAVVSKIIEEKNGQPNNNKKLSVHMKSRRALYSSSPANVMKHVYEKIRQRLMNMIPPLRKFRRYHDAER